MTFPIRNQPQLSPTVGVWVGSFLAPLPAEQERRRVRSQPGGKVRREQQSHVSRKQGETGLGTHAEIKNQFLTAPFLPLMRRRVKSPSRARPPQLLW